MNNENLIYVSVGIIICNRDVLLSLRSAESDQGGLWEFPGGKVEKGETTYEALHRELFEELDIKIFSAQPLLAEEYQYPKYKVNLNPFIVTKYTGIPKGSEGQKIAWFDLEKLNNINMPSANYSIIKQLDLYAIHL